MTCACANSWNSTPGGGTLTFDMSNNTMTLEYPIPLGERIQRFIERLIRRP